jgi:uncharacterized membrane protein
MEAVENQGRDPAHVSRFLIGLARAVAGALLLSIPMRMTMETRFLGFYMEGERLLILILLLLNLPLFVCLSHRIGFGRSATWRESAREAVIA